MPEPTAHCSPEFAVQVFGAERESVGMFEIPGLLAAHLTSIAAPAGGGAAAAAARAAPPARVAARPAAGSPAGHDRPLVGPVVLSGRLTSLICGGLTAGYPLPSCSHCRPHGRCVAASQQKAPAVARYDDSRKLTLPSERAVLSKLKACETPAHPARTHAHARPLWMRIHCGCIHCGCGPWACEPLRTHTHTHAQ